MNPLGVAGRLAADGALAAEAAVRFAGTGALRPLPPGRALSLANDLRVLRGSIASGLAVAAARSPEGLAIADDLGTLTWRELHERSGRWATLLHEAGAGPDRPVQLMCRNGRAFVEALAAASRLGADVLLLNTDFPGPQLALTLERAPAGVVVCDGEFAERFAAAGHDGPQVVVEDAEARLGAARVWPGGPPRRSEVTLLTSGTTGAPKAASRSPSPLAVAGPAVTLLRALRPRSGAPILIGPPLFHGFGLAFLGVALAVGAPVVLRRRFDPDVALDDVARHRVAVLVGVPVMLQRILAAPRRDTSSLRTVVSAAAPLTPQLAQDFQDRFGEVLFNLYGSTEVGFAGLATPADLRRAPGTVGRPPAGTRVAILDADRRPVPAGGTGTVFVGSGMVFDGYTGGGSKEVVDGMMSTGDLGRFDADGLLHVEGREDDMVVSGGENVFPQEIEELLEAHEAVADVAVVGVPDAEFGQRLRACVVLREGASATAEELQAHVKAHAARFKVPRDVVFLDEIPRNPTGKVLRRDLAAD